MPANNSKGVVHYWAGAFGQVGHLYSPGPMRGPWPWLPYALDNGAFPAFTAGTPWNERAYVRLLCWAAFAPIAPRWALVPDVVADREATLTSWDRWAPKVSVLRCPLAFAVQDGMTPDDVPRAADVIFVGGSTKPGSMRGWKWDTLPMWCAAFPRVHVGRVNGYAGLVRCAEAGAESCDGTGWFRGDARQLAGLERFLKEQHAGLHPPPPAVARPAAARQVHPLVSPPFGRVAAGR